MTDREEPCDRESVLKHQPSFSDSGRSFIPMWDSSDPERAPPPLPLNPATASPATKPNTSKAITIAAEALQAKARECAYTINPLPHYSPEKSPTRGHKRFDSLQNGSLRNRNSYTDALRSLDRTPSPEKSPERAPRTPGFDKENRGRDMSFGRSSTPTPSGRGSGKETPSHGASRPILKPILGESTPPSATMLALQNMPVPKDVDSSLADITNHSSPNARPPQSMDAISSQILSLTTIATSLQKEMAQLSRRSKDNATDLISLKEATNSRDEDIRKSLKDLSQNLSTRLPKSDREHDSRAGSSFGHRPGSFLLDSKPHNFDQSLPKSFSIPRMGSPGFNASELSSSSYNVEGPASIALLEKIVRDMGTREGQEALASTLAALKDASTPAKADPQVIKRLEEIQTLMKNGAGSQALVHLRENPQGNNYPEQRFENPDLKPAPLNRAPKDLVPQREAPRASISPKAAEFVNEDLQKLLKKMKDSITEAGGMTAEVKAHLRELRGEVLGMGRDIARKLDQAESTSTASRGEADGPGREEIAQIVQDGLCELKSHMDTIIRERRRQSSSSMASRHSVDSQEVYNAVKNALNEFPQQQLAVRGNGSGIEREEILDAVREAWETYKPEIELQNFGLERDEILQCLKDGLQEYQHQKEDSAIGSASYEDVLDAVREGLQEFKPQPTETEASITQEDILVTVRECLESFDFPTSQVDRSREPGITRDDVLDAVKEGLSAQAPVSKDMEFNRDDLFDAVKAGLQGTHTPLGGVGEQVLDKMEELINGMRIEFKQYSEANGGDTEQILDAMKDGLEVLRSDIESYVNRAQDVTGKDEILETLKHSLSQLHGDLEESITNSARPPAQASNVEMLDAMEKEFDHLRQTIASSMIKPEGQTPQREDILEVIREGLEGVKSTSSRVVESEDDGETLNLMREEFAHLRETLATTLVQGGSTQDKEEMLEAIREGYETMRGEAALCRERPASILSNTSELLDAFNEGLETLRGDLEKIVNRPLDMTVNYEILETLKEGLANVRSDLDRLQRPQSGGRGASTMRNGEVVIADPDVEGAYRSDIGKLEMMITQLQIKVEAMDHMAPPPTAFQENGIAKEQFESLENMLREVQTSVAETKDRDVSGTVSKDDMDAFETLLRNTKAKVEEIGSSESEGIAKVSHFESLESIVNETRDAVADLESGGASKKDTDVLEALLKEVRAGLEDLREKGPGGEGERVCKTDIEALETLCMDTKTQITEMPLPDPENLPTKIEVEDIGVQVRKLADQAEQQHELTAQAFEARKVEHGGLADKIEDIKLIFEDVREELKARIQEGHANVKDIGQTLDTFAETVMAADTTATVEELRDNIKQEFETIRKASDGIKDHNEENHAILLDKHSGHKDEIISELTNRLDARFDEIMTKYDDAQLAAQEKDKALGSKGTQQEEILSATKTAAEDLRILVDALGSSVTEQCERMSEDSKTVFSRVEEVGFKLDQLLAGDGKAEHQETRAEISRALIGLEAIQAHASEYEPKILDSIHAVLAIVGQHYEQAKTSTEEIKSSVSAIPGSITLPAIAPSPEPTSRDIPTHEKYDDSAVHSKLDQLVFHAAEAGKTMAEFAVLEQIKEKVTATSTSLIELLASQQTTAIEASESKAKEAEEAAIALEKRVAQKSLVESDIVRLSGEKVSLHIDVQKLRSEKDELAALKSRMQADLSSLETALEIRREELQVMEARADGLERRILDGVLDHSRSLLTTSSRPQSSLQEMNRKRVVSTTSNADTAKASSVRSTVPFTAPSAISSGLGMALKTRQPPRSSAANSAAGGKNGRRILSLSTLSGNRGTVNDRAMVLANSSAPKTGGLGMGMKRSHSVKSHLPSRKSSWGGTDKSVGLYHDADTEDKENSILDEEDEEGEWEGSEAGTERMTSYMGTESGSGSYFTESESGKRRSYAPSTAGTIGTRDFAIDEEGETEAEPEEANQTLGSEGQGDDEPETKLVADAVEGEGVTKQDAGQAGGLVLFGQQSDSGLGTDLPTALVEGGSDYFVK